MNASEVNACLNLVSSAPASGLFPWKSRIRKSTSCGSRSAAKSVARELPSGANSELFQMIGPPIQPWLNTCSDLTHSFGCFFT